MSSEERIVYSDLPSLVELYRNGDLPQDEMAWQYYVSPGKIAWAHRDELKMQLALGVAYPLANTQKNKK